MIQTTKPLAMAYVLSAMLCSLVLAQAPKAPEKSIDEGESTILKDDLSKHVGFLASDDMKGRDAGSRHAKEAAAYIAQRFEAAGLLRAGDGAKNKKSYEAKFAIPGKLCRNVCGLLRGSSSRLKREVIVVGAHFDHVGLGMRGNRRGEVHNGADDNASGTSALLELVDALAKSPPKRSVLFIAFSAEEKGLLGSKAWCKKPTMPIGKVVAMINLDMIGRSKDGYLFVGGVNTARGLEKIVREENKAFDFNLELHGGGNAPSDNSSFFKKKIPVLFFFTAEHAQYHSPDDDPHLLNLEAETKIVRLVYRVLKRLANGKRPKFVNDSRSAMPRASRRGEDYIKTKLGLTLDAYDPQQKGMPVRNVEGAWAQRSRMRNSDVILSLNGHEARTAEAVQSVLATAKKGARITIKIGRGKKVLTSKMTMK